MNIAYLAEQPWLDPSLARLPVCQIRFNDESTRQEVFKKGVTRAASGIPLSAFRGVTNRVCKFHFFGTSPQR